MAQMPSPRRPVIAEPVYIFSHSALDVARVGADQHLFQAETHDVRAGRLDHGARDPGIGVGLADADQAVVGVDLHDEIVLRGRAGVGAVVRREQHEAFDRR